MYVHIKKSTNKEKKLMAIFYNNEKQKIKTTHFGASGYSDFTQHKDEERKQRYLERHKKNEDWNDYTSAGSLSRHILWNKPTLKASIEDYKKKFKLK
jgi:type III secretory pathway component EscR